MDFGAARDGVTNDLVALRNALQSGKLVDGGFYRLNMSLHFAANATGSRQVHVKVNGVADPRDNPLEGHATIPRKVPLSLIVYCEAGHAVEVWGRQDSGGALNVDLDRSFFEMELLRLSTAATSAGQLGSKPIKSAMLCLLAARFRTR